MFDPRDQAPTLADRASPSNLDAEKAVLGAMLINEDSLTDAIEILKPDDFYSPSHKKVFDVIFSLYSSSQSIDTVLVSEVLDRQGDLKKIGGLTFLADLTLDVPSLANAKYYAGIVREKSHLRALLKSTMEVQEKIFSGSEMSEVLEMAESKIFAISEERIKGKGEDIKSIMQQVVQDHTERLEGRGQSTGLRTHYHDLMQILGGFRNGEVGILAARPSMGKTSFALNLMLDFSIQQNIPTVLFSLEMGAQQIANNLVCIDASIDGDVWRNHTADLDDSEVERLQSTFGRMSEAPILIDDEAFLTPVTLRSKLRRYIRDHKIEVAFIDYLQLMSAPEIPAQQGRTQEISHISRSVKSIAREMNIPIIALAQLSRLVEQRVGNKPKMADLRESGSIEQDADVIMLLHRPDYYNEEERPGEVDVIVAKHRNGPTGTAPLRFVKSMMRFENGSSE